MPRHSKHDKAKRPWYGLPTVKEQRTLAQRVFALALKYDWEIRPQVLGIWIIARGDIRIHTSWSEDGNELKDGVLWRPDREDRKLTVKQIIRLIAMKGELQGK